MTVCQVNCSSSLSSSWVHLAERSFVFQIFPPRPGFELTPCHPHQRVSPPPPIPHARAHARHHRRRRCCCCCPQTPPSHRIGIGKKRDGYRTSVSTKIGSVSNLCMNPDPLSPRSPFFPTTGQRFPTLARGLF